MNQIPLRTIIRTEPPRSSTVSLPQRERPTRRLPRHPPELVRLFHTVEALRADDRPLLLQFVAANPGEGTTTVARGLALIAATESGRPALLIDASGDREDALDRGRGQPSLAERLRDGLDLLEQRPGAARGDLLEARLCGDPSHEARLAPGEARLLFYGLAELVHTTILDCGALPRTPDSLGLARHCDGTILVVRAETTRASEAEDARRAIERAGGHVVGAVLNRVVDYIPSWLALWI